MGVGEGGVGRVCRGGPLSRKSAGHGPVPSVLAAAANECEGQAPVTLAARWQRKKQAPPEGTQYARFLAGGRRRTPLVDTTWRFGGRKAQHQGKCRTPSLSSDQLAAKFGPSGSFRYARRGEARDASTVAVQGAKLWHRSGKGSSRGATERTEVAANWDDALDEDAADGLPLWWYAPDVVIDVSKGRKQWHCSGRGAALCRLSARCRMDATPRFTASPAMARRRRRKVSLLPSEFARLFATFLPVLVTALVSKANDAEPEVEEPRFCDAEEGPLEEARFWDAAEEPEPEMEEPRFWDAEEGQLEEARFWDAEEQQERRAQSKCQCQCECQCETLHGRRPHICGCGESSLMQVFASAKVSASAW